MAKLVEEVLDAWRDGERLLAELPAFDPDVESVVLSVATLRELYQMLTSTGNASSTALANNESSAADAARVIAEARKRAADVPTI
jgi:hypothetical protein